MRFPPAGRPRYRRQRRFTQAVENGSRWSSFLIQIFQSWHFYGWTVTDVEQNNPLSYSSREFWLRRREADVKDHISDRPKGEKKKKKDTRKHQQASATAPWKSMRGTCGVLMTRSLKKRASLNGAKWRDSWNLEITDASAASACFHLWHPQHQNLVTASGLTSLCNRRPRCTLEFTNFHLCSQNLSSQRARRLDPPSVSCRAEQNAARA